jgi:hypothetical protein
MQPPKAEGLSKEPKNRRKPANLTDLLEGKVSSSPAAKRQPYEGYWGMCMA